MKEIRRYKLVATESNSKNVIKCDDGHWVHYSDVEQLKARIKELESEQYINEIKAQGIEEFMQNVAYYIRFMGYTDSGQEINWMCYNKQRLDDYAKKLRRNNEQ